MHPRPPGKILSKDAPEHLAGIFSSGMVVYAAWSIWCRNSLPVATHSIIPNDFARLDLHQATTIRPSAVRAFKWRLPANTQTGSSFPSPHAHPMFPAGALIVWQLPLRPRSGHAKDGEGWASKVEAFSGEGDAVAQVQSASTQLGCSTSGGPLLWWDAPGKAARLHLSQHGWPSFTMAAVGRTAA